MYNSWLIICATSTFVCLFVGRCYSVIVATSRIDVIRSYMPGGANVHPRLTHGCLSPLESRSRTASRLIQPIQQGLRSGPLMTTVESNTKVREIVPTPRRVSLLSVTNATPHFGYLSCTDFDHFWNERHESVCRCVQPWKFFKFLRRGDSAEICDNFEGMRVRSVQLKRHNLWR